MSEQAVVPISANLLKKVRLLFRAGRITISLGYIGLVLVLAAGVIGGEAQVLLHYIGCALIFLSLTLVVVASRRARGATASLKSDLPLLDDLQLTALRVTEIADVTQNFAFKHLMRAQRAFTSINAMVEKVPFVGSAVKRAGFIDLGEVSSRLATATLEANNRVRLLQEALRNADLKGVQEYGRQVDVALAQLRKTLDADAGARPA